MKRTALALAGLLALAALPVSAEPFRFLRNAEKLPADCDKLAEVESRAGGPNWTLFLSDARIKKQARKRLLAKARKAGANTLVLTDHRAFLRPESRELEKVEESGAAYRCPQAVETD